MQFAKFVIMCAAVVATASPAFACDATSITASQKSLADATTKFELGESDRLPVLSAMMQLQAVSICRDFQASKVSCAIFRQGEEQKLEQQRELIQIGELSYADYQVQLLRVSAAIDLCAVGN